MTSEARTRSASTGAASAQAAIRRAVEPRAHAGLAPAPVIAEPSSSGVTRRRVDVGDEAAAQDHLEACRTGRSARRGRRRSAAPPGLAAGRRGCGPRSRPGRRRRRPRVGWAAISTLGLAAHLPADDELLLVAAGQRGRGHVDAGRADVVLRRRCARCPCARPSRSIHGPLTFGACGLVAEDAVLPQRRLEQQALPVPVLGDVADAGLAAAPGVPGGDVLAAEVDGAGRAGAACP